VIAVRTAPSGKLNVKLVPHLAYVSVFVTLLVFSRLFFFCVFRCVSRWLRVYYSIDQCFSTGFREWLPGVPPKQTEIAWDEIRNHSSMQL